MTYAESLSAQYTRTKQMFTAPLRSPAKATADQGNQSGKQKPQPIINMLTDKLTQDNIAKLGFVSFEEIDKQFKIYLSGEWEAGYGGLPTCLRICLLAYSLLILQMRFGVQKWVPDLEACGEGI